jgi:hypothetical protein
MHIPEHIKHRAMSAINSKETAALLKNVQKASQPTLTQAVVGQVADSFTTVAAKTGWLPLAGIMLLYAARISERDSQPKHKNKFLGIDL